MEIRSLIEEVLDKGYILNLATYDDGGVWVSPVIYLHGADFNIYWISPVGVRHSRALENNPEVAGSIIAVEDYNKELALQIEGRAEKIDGPIFELEKKHRKKRGLEEPKRPGEILESNENDPNEDESWYVLKPRKIELINNELFGFEKKIYELN